MKCVVCKKDTQSRVKGKAVCAKCRVEFIQKRKEFSPLSKVKMSEETKKALKRSRKR